jgi:hypothetical protein
MNKRLKKLVDDHILKVCTDRLGAAEVARIRKENNEWAALTIIRSTARYGQIEVAEEIGTATWTLSKWINNATWTPLPVFQAQIERVLGENPYK